MDVIAIAGAVGTAGMMVFGVMTDVELNAKEIQTTREVFAREIKRVDDSANKDRHEILQRLEETKEGMEVIRTESAAGRLRIESKLDRLIESKIKQ
jgi:hypothetical protein